MSLAKQSLSSEGRAEVLRLRIRPCRAADQWRADPGDRDRFDTDRLRLLPAALPPQIIGSLGDGPGREGGLEGWERVRNVMMVAVSKWQKLVLGAREKRGS